MDANSETTKLSSDPSEAQSLEHQRGTGKKKSDKITCLQVFTLKK